jgi:hypothetical protein
MWRHLHVKNRYARRIFMKLEFFGQSFDKVSNINFIKPVQWESTDRQCGQTDGQT